MKVLKKNGEMQDFKPDKIRLVLERISDESHQPLTASDINAIITDIVEAIERWPYNTINTLGIRYIVGETLKKSGFSHIAKVYDSFERGFA